MGELQKTLYVSHQAELVKDLLSMRPVRYRIAPSIRPHHLER